jgi:hypothetical protein
VKAWAAIEGQAKDPELRHPIRSCGMAYGLPGLRCRSFSAIRCDLEAYAKARKDFPRQGDRHKKARTVHLGEHVTLIFEDQSPSRPGAGDAAHREDLRGAGIQGELDAYNPLIPDGATSRTTMMIEYEEANERSRRWRA